MRDDQTVQPPQTQSAMAAAVSMASALDLTVDDAVVLHNSNKLALRLLPCDVLARVATVGQEVARFEVELARRLAETGSPVAALEPRVEPRVYERDGFAVTLWTYYATVTAARGLTSRLRETRSSGCMPACGSSMSRRRTSRIESRRLSSSLRAATSLRRSPTRTGSSSATRCESRRRAIGDRGAAEQLLHGEPHPGNVLSTQDGLLFIDLETCCRGPVEFDLAHVPEEVSERYPDADQELLRECRILMLAMVAAWRWDRADEFPNGRRMGTELLSQLRAALELRGHS